MSGTGPGVEFYWHSQFPEPVCFLAIAPATFRSADSYLCCLFSLVSGLSPLISRLRVLGPGILAPGSRGLVSQICSDGPSSYCCGTTTGGNVGRAMREGQETEEKTRRSNQRAWIPEYQITSGGTRLAANEEGQWDVTETIPISNIPFIKGQRGQRGQKGRALSKQWRLRKHRAPIPVGAGSIATSLIVCGEKRGWKWGCTTSSLRTTRTITTQLGHRLQCPAIQDAGRNR